MSACHSCEEPIKVGEHQCEVCQEENLPAYHSDYYRQFVRDIHEHGGTVQHYRGRFYYEGPATVVDDIQSAIRATSVVVQWDNMGLGWIVYPKG